MVEERGTVRNSVGNHIKSFDTSRNSVGNHIKSFDASEY